MSGERFDSGGVLSRARPVLTFATAMHGDAPAFASAPGGTPAPVLMSWSGAELPRRNDLPVIPRIVRRTATEQILEPITRAVLAARRAGGMLLFGVLGLATLGAIAGLGLRSFPEEASTPVVSGAAQAFGARATERLFARAPLVPRVDRTIPPPAPRVAVVAVRASPASPHVALAAAHTPRKHTAAPTALTRR
jgi:hypothetical protein